MPTPDDQVIDSKDVLLLQYAYSDKFAYVIGSKVQRLFAKFGVAFATSINCASLRHAMLAYTAAFAPISSGYELMEYHSEISCQALKRKTCSNITEGDLLAACLLTYLSCSYRDPLRFRIHLGGVIALTKECFRKSRQDNATSRYAAFWPIAYDLILEGSRNVSGATIPILNFCHISQQVHGHQGIARRVDGHQVIARRVEFEFETYGVNWGLEEFAFAESMFHYYVLLRRCLWLTVCMRTETGTTEVPCIRSVMSEIKADLKCNMAKDIVFAKGEGYPWLSANEAVYPHVDRIIFPLLLHRVCLLLIAILEDEMVWQGSPTKEVVQAANVVLHLLHRIEEFGSEYPWNHIVRIAGKLVPRILCIISLGLGCEIDNKRRSLTLRRN